jgi:Spy/CpxP family protein refolding chaperone
MIRNRCLWAVLPIAWMVGCQGNVSEGTATTTAAPLSSVAAAPVVVAPVATATTPRKAFGHHGGPASAYVHAARNLTLTAAQQTSLDSIEATLHSDEDAMHTAMTAFHADLSAGVKAGALDAAKLAADSTAVESTMADHRAKEAAALVSLHTLLDPSQRTALVAAIRAKQAEHEAHMASWKAKEGTGAHADWQKKRLDKLTGDLALDATQQQKVAAILAQAKDSPNPGGMEPHHEEMKQHSEALLTAFAADSFDAAQAEPKGPQGKAVHEPMTGHLISFVSQMLPILRSDQREKFASSMESGFHGGPLQGPGDDAVEPAPVE